MSLCVLLDLPRHLSGGIVTQVFRTIRSQTSTRTYRAESEVHLISTRLTEAAGHAKVQLYPPAMKLLSTSAAAHIVKLISIGNKRLYVCSVCSHWEHIKGEELSHYVGLIRNFCENPTIKTESKSGT